MKIIEVFKTNIAAEKDAVRFNILIVERFPEYQVNFDLDDCDHIMRVVSHFRPIDIEGLTNLATHLDVKITALPDEVPV